MDIKTACIAIAAVIMAIEAGLKNAPTLRGKLPAFATSEIWNFIPLVLLTIAGGIWAYRQLNSTPIQVALSPNAAPTIAQAKNATVVPIKGAFIKPDDQSYAGNKLNEAKSKDTDCVARIVHCPSTECEDDAQAISVILTLGQWHQSGLPTSHDWEQLSKQANSLTEQRWPFNPARVVIHQAIFDNCATELANSLYEIGVKNNEWGDPAMRGKGVQILVGLVPRDK